MSDSPDGPSIREEGRSQCSQDEENSLPSHTCTVFYLPEILEMILLDLDMLTLLISRRVCHTWNEMIKSSRRIQQALFYIPIESKPPDQQAMKNPLVVDKIWFDFLRTELVSRFRVFVPLGGGYRRIPRIASEKREKAYMRPEASWRGMLLQQPPTDVVRFWNPKSPNIPIGWFADMADTHAKWMPNKDHIRMENVAYWIDTGAFSPGPLPFLCWDDPSIMRKAGGRRRLARNSILSEHLLRFDLTINTESYGSGVWWGPANTPVKPSTLKIWSHKEEVQLLQGEPA
ncbi:hypothetical protein BO82DRAFT_400691 [Aspergillus uvarum CBS 121591]|uniref:F-box domain-containing protein n=1 Tax=Aspergillus uvarum CBS 121591 TaxID=1448315 RepID=A0A319CG09_9EURO|nr:hypothetical protein BO82DRAFT_400691 [Aspergillus uvarum CBS 121591]PYH83299.1 hypothetical protein BO82DRAFT_400691 [Aspergillus uvarum CBS 121591]